MPHLQTFNLAPDFTKQDRIPPLPLNISQGSVWTGQSPSIPDNTARRKGDYSPGQTPALNTLTPPDFCCNKKSEASNEKNGLIQV